MELYTKRLRLRPFTKNDRKAVHIYASDPETVKFMTFGPNTKKDTKDFISRTLEAERAVPRRQYDFALEKLDDARLIGACGIYLREPGQAEIGWVLNREFHNLGYMTEAARELVNFAFDTLELHRVYARCDAENHSSRRVMEKCGMSKEAALRKVRKLRSDPDGPWRDEYIYAIIDDDLK